MIREAERESTDDPRDLLGREIARPVMRSMQRRVFRPDGDVRDVPRAIACPRTGDQAGFQRAIVCVPAQQALDALVFATLHRET